MPTWNRILCAVDFSQPSRLAMEAAADLARRFGARLTLVHVHEAPTAAAPGVLLAPPEPSQPSARQEEKKHEQWRADAQLLAGTPVNSLLLNGPAAFEIVRAAQEDRSGLVVVGTRDRTRLKRVVLGSVAEHVLRTAPCPVFVMRTTREPLGG